MTNFFPRLSAWVELPPCGYKVFELTHGDPPAPEGYRDFISVSNSGISSLKAKDGTELLAGPIGLVAISDTSDTWAHGIRIRDGRSADSGCWVAVAATRNLRLIAAPRSFKRPLNM